MTNPDLKPPPSSATCCPRSASTSPMRGPRRSIPPITPEQPLAGLALSGGGIRSATFNLGILQALAEAKKLRRFDYLSTVSGGGYIGGWLTAWIHRQGLDQVETTLATSVSGTAPEPHEVKWLRAHSNYLTPRKGLFSLDTLWGACTYVRNLLINQLLLFALIVFVLVGGATANGLLLIISRSAPAAMWTAGAIVLLLAAPLVGFEFASLRGQPPRKCGDAARVRAAKQARHLAHRVLHHRRGRPDGVCAGAAEGRGDDGADAVASIARGALPCVLHRRGALRVDRLQPVER